MLFRRSFVGVLAWLAAMPLPAPAATYDLVLDRTVLAEHGVEVLDEAGSTNALVAEIGRASCRERVCELV